LLAAREDVLDVYARPDDAARPRGCAGEGGQPLLGDVRAPLPVRPGSPAQQDCAQERGGRANGFRAFEPLAGRRPAAVTGRKTAEDFARFLRRWPEEW
jgi:hypothetical protein